MVATLTKLGEINRGDKVSYGGTFTAQKKMKIGVVPAGYYEGLDRRLSNKGFLRINGQYCPILGRVCMNLTVIGLVRVKAKLWDDVEIISNNKEDKNSVENIAKIGETIPYEILVKLEGSVRRVVEN